MLLHQLRSCLELMGNTSWTNQQAGSCHMALPSLFWDKGARLCVLRKLLNMETETRKRRGTQPLPMAPNGSPRAPNGLPCDPGAIMWPFLALSVWTWSKRQIEEDEKDLLANLFPAAGASQPCEVLTCLITKVLHTRLAVWGKGARRDAF